MFPIDELHDVPVDPFLQPVVVWQHSGLVLQPLLPVLSRFQLYNVLFTNECVIFKLLDPALILEGTIGKWLPAGFHTTGPAVQPVFCPPHCPLL